MSELKRLHLFLPKKMINDLKEYAKEHSYANVSELVREIIRDWLKKQEEGQK